MGIKVKDKRKIYHLLAVFGAELVGTFLVCLVSYIASSLGSALFGSNMILVLFATAAAYASVTLLFGHISGGQFNPAITLAAMLTDKTNAIEGICEIVAQVIGAICSGALVTSMIPRSDKATAAIWFTGAMNGFDKGSVSYTQVSTVGVSFNIWIAFVVEALAALLIVAVAMRTMNDPKISSVEHATGMGFAYAAGVALTYPITGSALNPARATGIAIFLHREKMATDPLQQLWLFWIAPILAAAVVATVMIIASMIAQSNADNTIDVIDGITAEHDDSSQTPYGMNVDSTPEQDTMEATEANVAEALTSQDPYPYMDNPTA